MKHVIVLFAIVVSLFAFAVSTFAQTPVDISGSTFEIRSGSTLRLHNVGVAGQSGKWWADIQWDSNGLIFIPIAGGLENAPPPPPQYLAQTELLKGKWHFIYTIISTWTDTFILNNIPGATNSQGGYFIHGTDQFNGPVVAAYWPADGNWSLLNPGIILIDEFFFFYTDGNVIKPNSCYYQITKSTGAFSRCYALSGSKFAAADTSGLDAAVPEDKAGALTEKAAQATDEMDTRGTHDAAPTSMSIMEKYWIIKGLMGR